MGKSCFKPFDRHAEPISENLEKLNAIRSLYYGYQDSGLPTDKFAEEFYLAVGELLVGTGLKDLKLKYIEFDG